MARRCHPKGHGANNRGTVEVVLGKKICCGCGACMVACPTSCIRFVYGKSYNYPSIDAESCTGCGRCLKVCPSAFLLKGTDPGFSYYPENAELDCYLLHSPDDEIRLHSSSGGFITALILHLIEKGQIDGGIVARCKGPNAIVAESFIATDRESLLTAQASKYCPVSSCTVLKEVLDRPGRYAFVGTPCMVQGLRSLQEILPLLKERVVLAIGLVCAGMASREGTRRYIENEGGVDMKDVRRICYRGNGWPGRFRALGENGEVLFDRPLLGGSLVHVVPYKHYLRCWNCLDHWAKYADIVVSDPWTEEMVENETKGWSAIMIRTRQGKEAVASAVDGGDLISRPITVKDMLGYNKHLVIAPGHARYGWIAAHQLLFFGRLRHLATVTGAVVRGRKIGLVTTARARFTSEYYC